MAYIGKSPSGTGVRSRFFYTQSSAGATSISGNDDDNRTLTFSDAEYVDVYLNGSLLAKGDYTAASNTISGLAALASGDIVEVVVYDIFTVADTVSAKDGGTFSGNVTFSGDLAVGVASPETKVHIEGDVSGLNNGNVMHIESNGAGGNRGINIGQIGDGSQATMFLQGYHSQSTTNYWNLALNPYGQYVTIGDDNTSLFNAVGSNSRLTVVGNTSNTSSLGNSDAAINIVNTNGTAGNTAGLHFSRQDTDGTPNYSGASIVAQFPEAQVTGQYPKGKLHFHTSTSANAAPSLKMTIDEAGRVTMPNTPSFTVNGVAAVSTTPGNSQVLNFGSVILNNGNHFNISQDRFVAPVAGHYFFSYSCMTSTQSHTSNIVIRRNGSGRHSSYTQNATYLRHNIAVVEYLNANDYVDIVLEHGGIHAGFDHFSGYLIG